MNRFTYAMFVVVLIISSYNGKAQLCTGSLGDPVVKLDFGSGSSSHGNPLGSSITSYTYSSADFPNDGYYTIESTTNSPNIWWTTTDHTGGGYMMVVNASLSITDYFYKNTVSGLCPGTTYEFAAWIMNLLRSTDNSLPNITFTIETLSGTILNSYNTGDISMQSGSVWKQYGFYFTTPADVSSVVIRMRNNKVGAAPGNDIALDDITFRPCGPTVTSFISDGSMSKNFCEGETVYLDFKSELSGGYDNPSYQWQVSADGGNTWADISGATLATYSIELSEPGTYLYRLSVASGANISSASCRIASGEIKVAIHSTPAIEAQSNDPSCYYEDLQLLATTGEGGSAFMWTGPNGFSSTMQNPLISSLTAANNGWYYVTITTFAGCVNTDSVIVNASNSPTADAGDDAWICEGASVTLEGSGSGVSFSWTPASTLSDGAVAMPVATPSDTTTYVLTVSNGTCINKDSVTVYVWKKPEANAGNDMYIVEGTSVLLNGSAQGDNITYYWTPFYNISSESTLTPEISPDTDITYTLHVVSGNGCGTATDNVTVRVYDKISIPNAFSPNGDGINDTWKIAQISSYTNADISVFNRFGQLVFHSRGYLNEWNGTYNGKPLPVGTYYYVIDLKALLPLRYSGWVVLLR